jgi:hypothetical protein
MVEKNTDNAKRELEKLGMTEDGWHTWRRGWTSYVRTSANVYEI